MSDRAPIPVTVVTGFLGAGKTTLVNRWLSDIRRGDVAIIVNEHGDVGIDGALLAARVRVLVEITGGCVCCATQGELVSAMDQIATAAQPPKRIVIETSGAASPAGVIHAISASARGAMHRLDGIVTVVDGTRLDALKEHDLAIEQIGYAEIVVLSRADRCTPEELARAEDRVASQNGAAVVVTSARGEIVDRTITTLDALLERRCADLPVPRVVSAPGGHRVYESVSLLIVGAVDGERFADFIEHCLARVAGRLLRTKGILAIAGLDERMIVQGIADGVEVTFGASWGDEPRTSRLVVVGFGLDREGLQRGFSACAAEAVVPA